jgi:hypothetical protein
MRHLTAYVAFALVALLVFAPVTSAQEKWVRGTVVSVTGDSFVVKAAGKDVTFKVDKATVLTARGAGRAQAKAEAAGAAGVKFADFVKPGVGVEVHYKDVGGTLMATEVQSGLAPSEGAASTEPATGGSARGAVTAVSGSSITIKTADAERVFTVDSKTAIVGQGLGTITRKFKEEGKSPTVTDLIMVNDTVIVYFQEAAGATRAGEIRVVSKAGK